MSALGFEASLSCYETLHAAYSEKHRFYHSIKHIEAMLRQLDAAKDLAEKPAELELAIYFHDAIYKIFSKSNERDSALWAQDFALSQGYSREGAERVYSLIMATAHDVTAQDGKLHDNDQKIIVDIDLSILGSSPEEYDKYERFIRKEYEAVPLSTYREKRKELLESFLERSSIYNLDAFQNKYESAARANISRAITRL